MNIVFRNNYKIDYNYITFLILKKNVFSGMA